jgi:hypothetical protein
VAPLFSSESGATFLLSRVLFFSQFFTILRGFPETSPDKMK